MRHRHRPSGAVLPARLIVENAGADGSVVVGKLLENKNANYGYDAQKGEYTDMVKAGIIDPTKVVRCALQDAASVAGLLVTTEAMVADRPGRRTRRRPPVAMAAWATWTSKPVRLVYHWIEGRTARCGPSSLSVIFRCVSAAPWGQWAPVSVERP